MYLCVSLQVLHVHVDTYGRQKKVLDPLELQLQVVVGAGN